VSGVLFSFPFEADGFLCPLRFCALSFFYLGPRFPQFSPSAFHPLPSPPGHAAHIPSVCV